MKDADVTTEQLDWLVLHQANQRILDAAAQRIGISSDRVVSNLAEYGNTSAASIPLAFDEAVRKGSIKSGDTVSNLCEFSWHSALVLYDYMCDKGTVSLAAFVMQIGMAGFGAGLTWAGVIVKWQ